MPSLIVTKFFIHMEGHNVYEEESLFVCLFVPYTVPHSCIYINQIWQNGKEPPWGFLGI